MELALNRQPVSVAVDGHNMTNYAGGIFSNCGTQLSVAALLVGATDSTYTLKFSWGVGWGEAGYIRLARRGSVCGVCNAYSFPNA
jgi:KDEL-tailed cysteine endopeptidase